MVMSLSAMLNPLGPPQKSSALFFPPLDNPQPSNPLIPPAVKRDTPIVFIRYLEVEIREILIPKREPTRKNGCRYARVSLFQRTHNSRNLAVALYQRS